MNVCELMNSQCKLLAHRSVCGLDNFIVAARSATLEPPQFQCIRLIVGSLCFMCINVVFFVVLTALVQSSDSWFLSCWKD